MLRVLSDMERSNLLLCNITKKSGKNYLFKRSVLKRMKEVSERLEPIENIFSGAYTECQKSETRNPESEPGNQPPQNQKSRTGDEKNIKSAWRSIRPDETPV